MSSWPFDFGFAILSVVALFKIPTYRLFSHSFLYISFCPTFPVLSCGGISDVLKFGQDISTIDGLEGEWKSTSCLYLYVKSAQFLALVHSTYVPAHIIQVLQIPRLSLPIIIVLLKHMPLHSMMTDLPTYLCEPIVKILRQHILLPPLTDSYIDGGLCRS
ncbi:hypothetical protein F5Y17DRAFT_87377 [Xylariaceae sp. FL0594]|nr:hypothetical protein F5Y17DRAFT_87377 [Xylariaceae sp. FL0594]